VKSEPDGAVDERVPAARTDEQGQNCSREPVSEKSGQPTHQPRGMFALPVHAAQLLGAADMVEWLMGTTRNSGRHP
jgi:hypothetical protein